MTPAPPARPERPEGVDRPPRWPAWYAAAAFIAGFTGTALLVGLVSAIAGLDANAESPGFVVLATLAQAVALVGTAVLFASFVSRPRPWHFGLRRTRFWPAVGWAAAGIVLFYFLTAIYSAAVPTDVEQRITDELGADEGTLGLIVAGVMVMVVAPVAEELFFRGFFYRALRSKFSTIAAAVIDGLFFGVIHFDFEGAEGLLLLPPLALLGFIFCIVYEKTGSLFPVIAMHAFNNTVAYAVQADDGWQVSVVVGPLVIAGCMLVPLLFGQRSRAAPA